MFNKYDSYLIAFGNGGDYWSDIGISEAVEFLRLFRYFDWEDLELVVFRKPSIWVLSCIETLAESDSHMAVLILFNIIKNRKESSVVVNAFDTLASMYLDKKIIGFDEEIKYTIEFIKINDEFFNKCKFVIETVERKLL
jgi:hypothetical protein